MQDATSLASAIASGRTTAPEVMKAALAAADARADLGAVMDLDPVWALAEAAHPQSGPFVGVPFLGKDLGSGSAHFPPGAGVDAMRRRKRHPGPESILFERFRKAGLVQAGLSTVPPFGLALTSDPARNPFDASFSPGGSSGGAAAAVASGIVAIAHATDAAGSIRVPAACSGLFGLKPSRNVVPGGPDFGNHLMGLASELVVARSLRDVAMAFEVATDAAPPAPVKALPRVALAIPPRGNAEQAGAAMAAARALEAKGCIVDLLAAPDDLGLRAAEIARTILTASLAEWMGGLGIPDGELPLLAAAVAAEGRAMPAARLFAASRSMAQVAFELWQRCTSCDVILSPVLADGPPRTAAFDFSATNTDAHFAQMEAIAPNAALANVAGTPALAIPFGRDARGLPIGLQLMGRPGADRHLLAWAGLLDEAAPRMEFPFPIAGHP